MAELQKWMRWVITDPRGPGRALENVSGMDVRASEPLPRRLQAVSSTPRLDAVRRLAVYADGYFLRLLAALSADFAAVSSVLGPQLFPMLVADYLLVTPSISPVIGELGRGLPSFLADHPLGHAEPFLPDLARLEWAVLESLFSDRSPALRVDSLASVPAADWPRAVCRLDASVQLLGTEWPVDLLWEDRHLPEPAGLKTLWRPKWRWLVVWRDEGWVRVESIDGPAWFALERLREGARLEVVCRELETHFGTEVPIMEWFGTWIQRGWVRDVHFS